MAVKIPPLLHKMSQAAQKAWYKKNNMEMPASKTPMSAAKAKVVPKPAAKPEPVKKPLSTDERMAAIKKTAEKNIRRGKESRLRAAFGGEPMGAQYDNPISIARAGGTIKGYRLGEAAKLNKMKKNEYIRQLGLKAMKAGKVDPAKGYIPTRAGREELKKEEAMKPNKPMPPSNYPGARLQRDNMRTVKRRVETPQEREDRLSALATGYKAGRWAFGGKYEQVEAEPMNEISKKEAEAVLGGPTKEKPKMPPGKQPAGYRYVRGLARKAMKAGMKKEEVVVDEAKKPDASMAMTNQLKIKAITTKDKQTLGKVADLMAAQKKLDNKNMKEESEMQYIEEKLTAADPASKWISDFVKSDNPKFAGKSKKERIQQALGAYYAAKGGKNEEVEQIDELKKSTLASYVGKAAGRLAAASRLQKDFEKNGHSALAGEFELSAKKKRAGIQMAANKLAKEEVGGKTPETDTEVELAKKHGNPKKITYGDVIKARIASAKKKAVGKGE